MSNLNQKRLDQMIDNALSYKQDVPEELFPWFKQFKNLLSKPIITSMAAASFIILTISFTCKTPIRPVETPITPNSSQVGIPLFAGDSGSKSLKLGLFLNRLNTLICPSKP